MRCVVGATAPEARSDPPARRGAPTASARLLLCGYTDPMTATAPAPPLILIAANPEHSLAGVLEGEHYAVVQVHTGTLALEWVRDMRPDTIILDARSVQKAGIEDGRLLPRDT